MIRDISEVADHCAEPADFHVGVRLLATFDALQEVLRVRSSRRFDDGVYHAAFAIHVTDQARVVVFAWQSVQKWLEK